MGRLLMWVNEQNDIQIDAKGDEVSHHLTIPCKKEAVWEWVSALLKMCDEHEDPPEEGLEVQASWFRDTKEPL